MKILVVLALGTCAWAQQKRCTDLRALTGYEFSIASADLIPAAQDVPEHCRVSGLVQPEVAFEVNLPAGWNGRLYMFGNGGFAGEWSEQPGRVNARARGLKNSYVTASTNTGHDARTEANGTFAASPQKFLDYSFRAVHVTAETAKKLAAAYYG